MKLSTKTRYGLRAALAIARQYGRGPVKRKAIARQEDITPAYLENILTVLKHQRFISTNRGAHGGFNLLLPPGRLSLLEIVTALEGPLAPVDCLENPSECGKTSRCVTRRVWEKLARAQEDVLRNLTLQDLLDWEKESGQPNYII